MAGGAGRVVTGAGLGGKARVEGERLWVDAFISGGGGGGGGGDVNIVAVGGTPVGGPTVPVSGTVTVASITAPVTVVEPLTVEQPLHDSLNANANIQVGNVDVAVGNPVPVSDAGGSLTVDGTVVVSSITAPVTIVEPITVEQPLHDSLNANANIQVGNTDVGAANPVPVSDNGGSLTVDGTVVVSSITAAVTIAEPVSVDDNGGSLTVDGTVVVSSITAPVTIVEPITVDQSLHDSLNANANIQVGNFDVSAANPVPVSDNGGSLTVDGIVTAEQAVHDNLNANANIQIGNVDVGGANPVPVSDNGLSLTVDGTVAVSSVGGTVTIAEPVSVDDNGGSLTVDGTVAVSSVTTSITPGTAATNLGKAEDAVHASGDVGVQALAVRQDTATALAANGDYVPLIVDSTGRLHTAAGVTSVTPGTAATNLGKAEDAVHASGDVGVMALAVRQDTPSALAANGDYTPLSTDDQGRLHVSAGSAAKDLGKAEDAAHTSGDVGVMALAVRQDTLAALASNGDYIPLTVDLLGRLNVRAYIVEPFTVLSLSSSTSGQPIAVDGVVFGTIHTVAASSIDVITIYVTNVGTTDRTLFLGWGGTATAQQLFCFVPAGETVVAVSEMTLGASQVVQARLAVAGTCRVFGRVTRRAV